MYLKVTVDFRDEGFDHTFTLRFRHDETPNQPGDVPDAVKLPIVHENDIVPIDDDDYKVTISGFLDDTGQVKPQCTNPEGRNKRVWLVARFELMDKPGT
ncbi:choice-of-anchor K domain-containing protein [Nocardia lijiangensis]|uniref:choice-of-anchor K domain-containing protein n=1 Tax=Nocardia lijiangensis TaxID=299618 RepID=UPI003D702E1D